jgi:hypothetical protein
MPMSQHYLPTWFIPVHSPGHYPHVSTLDMGVVYKLMELWVREKTIQEIGQKVKISSGRDPG